MTLMIDLPADVESRLKTEAERHGLEPREYARRLIEAGLPVDADRQRSLNQSTLDLLAQWERRDATEDAAELARRAAAVAEFKDGMNHTRLASEGPESRKPYP